MIVKLQSSLRFVSSSIPGEALRPPVQELAVQFALPGVGEYEAGLAFFHVICQELVSFSSVKTSVLSLCYIEI